MATGLNCISRFVSVATPVDVVKVIKTLSFARVAQRTKNDHSYRRTKIEMQRQKRSDEGGELGKVGSGWGGNCD